MFTLTLSSLKAKKVRFLLTAVAVMLGVAFMAGTLVLTDTIKQSYDNLTGNVYKDTDAVVRSSRHVASEENGEVRASMPASALNEVRATKGVAAAAAQQLGAAIVVARDGTLLEASPNRAAPIGMAWQDEPKLNPMDLSSGHAPRAPDEIVIDRASANKGDFAPGDAVRVVTKAGSKPYRLAGVATYAGEDNAAGAQVVAFTAPTAAEVLGTPGRYDAISVVAEPGVSQHAVVQTLNAAMGNSDTEAITGAQAADEAREATSKSLSFVSMFLMIFALVALFVGSFVIYNTFSITIAQRTKETALLRAIGAKRSQVMRSVMLESVFTGIVASAAGVVAGIGTAKALSALMSAFGVDLPDAGTVVTPRTIVVSMVVGILVTVVASYLPARRAGKVAPIAALRDVAIDRSGGSVKRAVIGVLVLAGGAAYMAMGLSAAEVGPVGLGAVAVFLGVAILGPVIARPFARVLGAPLPVLRGMPGTLARENASRNPRRTSATASALMIGIGLVAFITVLAASTKASISDSVDTAMSADWIVDTQWGMGGLTPAVAQQVDALPETGAVTAVRFTSPEIDGKATEIAAVSPETVDETMNLKLVDGSMSALTANDVAVQAEEATSKGLHVDDHVSMYFPETGTQQFTVAAIYGIKEPLGKYAITTAAYDANVVDRVDAFLVVSNAPGVSMDEARSAVDAVLADYPNATLRTQDEFKGAMAGEIDQMLNLIYVLLLLALVIALFGIANTLALSVHERTREFGLLRAVGTSRGQVRSVVRWESVLIALLGTVMGTVIGLGFAWAMVKALAEQGIGEFTIPVQSLGTVIALAAVAAVFAAALPARRAARLDVLKAISE